jgi:NDP-sugar pyrophosphorylase family protein
MRAKGGGRRRDLEEFWLRGVGRKRRIGGDEGGAGIGGNVFIGGNTRIYGGLTVDGSFNVTGSIVSTTIKETVRISERVDISNSGTGPGLTVRQYGTAAIADFYDDDISIMQIKDGGDVSMNKQLFVGGITSIKNTII